MRRKILQILVSLLILVYNCIFIFNIYYDVFAYDLLNIFFSGKFLSMLPVDPKLGKMLVMGAIFRCFDPVLTIVAGLSVRDPFLLPQDKKDVSININFQCMYLWFLFLVGLEFKKKKF